jgi:hypothetical protein
LQGISIQGSGTFTNTLLENITISNPTTYGIQIMAGASGGATFRNVAMISNKNLVPRLLNSASGFIVTEENTSAISTNRAARRFAAAVSLLGSRVLIDFIVPEGDGRTGSPVKVSLFQVNGRRTAILENRFPAGSHRVAIEKSSMCRSTGFYIVSIENAGKKQLFPVVFR